jgi:carboxypeptidase Q
VLIRSATPFSIYSVHTGNQKGGIIPAACITVEDAEMMQRMQNRGQKITLHLIIESK